MLYHGYWIDCVALSDDEQFRCTFLIRKRHSRDILAEAPSISQALQLVRELEDAAAPLPLRRKAAS